MALSLSYLVHVRDCIRPFARVEGTKDEDEDDDVYGSGLQVWRERGRRQVPYRRLDRAHWRRREEGVVMDSYYGLSKLDIAFRHIPEPASRHGRNSRMRAA